MAKSITRQAKSVTVVYRFLPQYRVDFFNRLREALADRQIELRLVYGKGSYVPRGDEADLPWGIPVSKHAVRVGGGDLVWLNLPSGIHESDLVILMGENRILNNYLLLARSFFRKTKVAFWGHGINFQSERNSLGNRAKRLYSTRVNWWFAYTEEVKRIVAGMGFPAEKVTVLNNAIDTRSLTREAERVHPDTLIALRNELKVGQGPIGLYCGGMYREKRLDFLLRTCEGVRQRIPDFEMIFVGAGEEGDLIRNFCATREWARYIKPLFGPARIPYFMIADVFLMPGVAGLAALDCFALQLPLATTNYRYRSPERAYLVNGENCIITEDNPDDYVNGVITLLGSPNLKARLKVGCRAAAKVYTLENMVDAFVDGVERALESNCSRQPLAMTAM